MKLLVVELKKGYNRCTLADLLDYPASSKQQVYEEWIQKAQRAARNAGVPYWFIIHQRDKREPLVIFPFKLRYELEKLDGGGHLLWRPVINYMDIVLRKNLVKNGRKKRVTELVGITVTTLGQFFRHVTPKMIQQLAIDKQHIRDKGLGG